MNVAKPLVENVTARKYAIYVTKHSTTFQRNFRAAPGRFPCTVTYSCQPQILE